jgi:tuftelin-interacting protein 11
MNFDADDDEFIPFSEKEKLKKKKSKRFNSWLGESESSGEEGEEVSGFGGKRRAGKSGRDDDFAFAAFMDEGSAGGFVSGGLIGEQLKKEPKKEVDPEKKKSKKPKKESAAAPVPVPGKLSLGASLLSKMGWTGGGVGKKSDGITVALEVKARPANAGLGMIEEKTEAMKKVERQRRGEEVSESSDEEAELKNAKSISAAASSARKVDRSQAWKKTSKKVQIKSAYDVLREEADEAPEAKMTIVDLTGATERVTDVRSLSAYERERKAENYTIGLGKEMRYNLDKLADLAEVELKQSSRIEAQLQKKKETFASQVTALQKTLVDCESMLAQVKEAQTLVNRLVEAAPQLASAASASEEATERMVAQMSKAFLGARSRYSELYARLRLPELLYSLVESSLVGYFARNTEALETDEGKAGRGVAMMESLRPLLENFASSEQGLDFWGLLQMVAVLPPLRTFISRDWDCKNRPHVMVDLVEAWKSVWNEDVLHHVLYELVLRKLAHHVEAWDAFTDEVPLHSWLHPWLPLMSHALEQLYPVVVAKLMVALADWDARDMSAHALLRPWTLIFSSSQMEGLAQTRVLPKLSSLVSSSMLLSPGRHDYRPVLDAVLVWHDFVPPVAFLKLLVRSVFPRVYRSVYQWALSRPSGASAIAWYKEFKSAFPAVLFKNPKICILFAHLLDVLLNVLVDKRTQFEPEVLLVDLFAEERVESATPGATPHLPLHKPVGAVPSTTFDSAVSFKAMVEAFAGERGILFVPLKHRTTSDGKPIFSFGGTAIYLANQLVYAELTAGKWTMVSLEHLAQLTQPRQNEAASAADVD